MPSAEMRTVFWYKSSLFFHIMSYRCSLFGIMHIIDTISV